jgi:hypothetical protein
MMMMMAIVDSVTSCAEMGKEHTEKNNEYVHLAQIMCTLYAI